MAVRHDANTRHPDYVRNRAQDAPADGGFAFPENQIVPNAKRKGNAVFVDGHASYETREFIHAVENYRWAPRKRL